MTDFHAFCRRSLDDIRAQGCYREFTALQKQAEHFPCYRRAPTAAKSAWSSNDYLRWAAIPW